MIPDKFGVSKKQFIFAAYKIEKMNLGFQNISLTTTTTCCCAEFVLSSHFMCMR